MINPLSTPLWGRGFRPFFFFGSIYCVVSMMLWGGLFGGLAATPDFILDPILWHAHEMLYGFTLSIVAGFLLTAVANWTGLAPTRKIHLAMLFFIWLAGRVVVNINMGLPQNLILAIELAFIPSLVFTLSKSLFQSKNARNYVFISLLSALFATDVWFFFAGTITPLYAAIMIFLTMISLIGGRIIPAFTVAALRQSGIEAFQTDQPLADKLALVSLLATAMSIFLAQGTFILSLCAGCAMLIHIWRMRCYHTLKSFTYPMVWILHAGYAWLIAGLGLLALTGVSDIEIKQIVHALTAGCIGTMCLGMMVRVTLGHTGRPLKASPMTVFAFFLIQLAAFMRLIGPWAWPEFTVFWYAAAAFLWGSSFLIYALVYGPMLLAPRPDGQAA